MVWGWFTGFSKVEAVASSGSHSNVVSSAVINSTCPVWSTAACTMPSVLPGPRRGIGCGKADHSPKNIPLKNKITLSHILRSMAMISTRSFRFRKPSGNSRSRKARTALAVFSSRIFLRFISTLPSMAPCPSACETFIFSNIKSSGWVASFRKASIRRCWLTEIDNESLVGLFFIFPFLSGG